jgi:stress-induced morphogen
LVLQQNIERKLNEAFHPISLQVLNESGGHSVPVGSETHFKVVIVSDNFIGLSRVQRQRRVYEVLNKELTSGLHALSMSTLTSAEWKQQPTIPPSPACLGGGER